MRVYLHLIGVMIFTIILPLSAQTAECVSVPRPVVEINLHEVPVKFDISKSEQHLSAMNIHTRAALPHSDDIRVGGVMSGQLTLDHRIGFKLSDATQAGQQCLGLSHVKIDITIEPTIFIAQDYQKQSCWFKVIFEHEAKHIAVDRAILAKYQTQLTDALNMLMTEPQDYTVLVSDDQPLNLRQNDLQQGLEAALEVMFNKMMADRTQQQQAIDNKFEYARLGASCRNAS